MASHWTLFLLCISVLYTKSTQHESRNVLVVVDENKGQRHSKHYDVKNARDSNLYGSIAKLFRLISSNNNLPSQKYYPDNEYQSFEDRYDHEYERPRRQSHSSFIYSKYPNDRYKKHRHRQYYQLQHFHHDGYAEHPYLNRNQEYRPYRERYQRRPNHRYRHHYEQYDSRELNSYEQDGGDKLYSHSNYYPKNQHRHYQNHYRYNQRHDRNYRAQEPPPRSMLRTEEQSNEQDQTYNKYQDQQNIYQSYKPRFEIINNNRHQSKEGYDQQILNNENQQYADNPYKKRYHLKSKLSQRNGDQQNTYQYGGSASLEDSDSDSDNDSREVVNNKYEHKSRILQILLRTLEKLACEEKGTCINICDVTSPPPFTACVQKKKYTGSCC